MNYIKELERLQQGNGTNGRLNVTIYDNLEDFYHFNSINMGDEEEIKTAKKHLEEEHGNYLEDGPVYEIDRGNGTPEYYSDAKEAYESI